MRRILAISLPLLLAFLLVSRGAEWMSENWWFGALDQGATWWTYLKWRGGAFAVAAPLWLGIVGLNVRLAWRQSLELREPLSLLGGMESISVELSPTLRLGRTLARFTVWGTAWLAALAAANRFDLWLLFSQSSGAGSGAGVSSGGADLRFFLFQLPALQWFFGWLGLALGLTFLASLTIYFWLEAIETGPGVLRAFEPARQHLSLLGALLIAWKGADCALTIVGAPVVFGGSPNGILGVPELLVGIPANQLFAWSALPVAALVFGLGAKENGRRALFLGGAWLFLASLTPGIAPAIARSVGMGNDGAEQQIIARHLDSTRRAWGFDAVENIEVKGNKSFAPTVLSAPNGDTNGVTSENPSDNASVNAPVVLWPVEGAAGALDARLDRDSTPALQAARLHIERVGDTLQWRAIATRRDATGEAPARELQAPAGAAGPLDWKPKRALDAVLLSEASPVPEAQANRLGPPPAEEAPSLPPLPRYRLTTQSLFSIERSSLGSCLVLALRFLDFSLATPGPPLMLHLDPVERASNLAPFVNWSGAIAHPVVMESGVGPHVYWLVEGCFSSRTYPDSATLSGSDAWGGVNYARQNVTAVFDATTGESQLYLFNRDEPIARAWDRALPGLFRPIEEMQPPLRAAIRPSPAALNALARVYARYHRTPGDEVLAWTTRQNQWRPILSVDNSATPDWSDALLPAPQNAPTSERASDPIRAKSDDSAPNATPGALAQWQLSAFAPARGTVDTGESAALLTAIAGVTLAPDGSWRWREWRPQQPLALPEFAAQTQIIKSDIGARFAPMTRVGVFPAFDSRGRADGFTTFRTEIRPARDALPATLSVQAATTGAPSFAEPPGTASLSGSLARARDLWKAILSARRAADWPLVARLEAQLGRALNAPAPAPASAPAIRPAPTVKPAARPTAKPAPAPG